VNLVFLPHAREQMQERHVSEEEVRETLESPDSAWTGRFGRIVVEKDFVTYILRVIYNEGVNEAVIITVIRKRKRGGAR
jgi:hypothetical protein